MNTKLVGAFLVALLTASMPLADAYKGKFPGKGSRAAWEKAISTAQKAHDAHHAGDLHRARVLYESAIVQYPDDADFHFNLALLYENDLHNLQLAERESGIACSLAPTDFDFASEYGVVLAKRRKYSQARVALEHASMYATTKEQKRSLMRNLAVLKREQSRKR